MTLIAIFPEIPVAIADCLVTNKNPEGPAILTPSIGTTHNVAPWITHQPRYLTRKSYEFEHKGMRGTFLFSGTVDHFKGFLLNLEGIKGGKIKVYDILKDEFDPSDTWSVIKTSLLQSKFDDFYDFTLTGILNGTLLSNKRISDLTNEFKYFGQVISSGSGRNLFIKDLKNRDEHYAEIKDAFDQSSILDFTHNIPSIFLEHDTRDNLLTWEKGVGGYYETYVGYEQKLVPLDNIATLFLSIKNIERHGSIEIRRLFFHFYVDNWLIVLGLAGTLPGTTEIPSFYWSMKIDEPLYVPLSRFFLVSIQPLLHQGSPPKVDLRV